MHLLEPVEQSDRPENRQHFVARRLIQISLLPKAGTVFDFTKGASNG